MAAGDAVIESGSLSGGGTNTITVPAGETWLISAHGTVDQVRLRANDGSNVATVLTAGQDANQMVGTPRPVFDSNTQPDVENANCTSEAYYIGGREI